MKSLAHRAKRRVKAARVYGVALLLSIAAMFHWPLAVTLLLLIWLAGFIYYFLKHVAMIGNLNEDLRELNN